MEKFVYPAMGFLFLTRLILAKDVSAPNFYIIVKPNV